MLKKNIFRNFLITCLVVLSYCSAAYSQSRRIPGNIEPTSLEIEAVGFLSDHGLLTNKFDNYEAGGTNYKAAHPLAFTIKPANNNPLTHTYDSKMRLVLKVRKTTDAAVGISVVGTGLGNYSAQPMLGQGKGVFSIEILSTNKLPNQIQILNQKIQWTITRTADSKILCERETGPHKVYLTFGTPDTSTPDDATVLTVKRMERAMQVVTNALQFRTFTNFPYLIGDMNTKYGKYNLEVNLTDNAWRPWTLPDQPAGADCITIATFLEYSCKAMGVPGTFGADTYIALYKTPTDGTRPIKTIAGHIKDPQHYINAPNNVVTPGVQAGWKLGLIDGDSGINNFEAAMTYIQGGQTYYILGGVPRVLITDVNDIVQVFNTLEWMKLIPDPADPMGAIWDPTILEHDYVNDGIDATNVLPAP